MPHPPILRGIQQVIDALKQAGHTVVEWQPYKHKYASDLATKILSADGGAAIKQVLALNNEPIIDNIKSALEVDRPMFDLVSFWKLQNERYAYQKEYLKLWQQQQPHIDGWILPVAPHAAIRHNQYKYYGYSTIANVLDWPAVSIPVTFADKEKDIKDMQYQSMNEYDAEIYGEYDADIYHGAPVGIQLVGKRLQEDYLLGLTEQIVDALKHST